MEIMQIWLWIGAVSNSQRGKRSLFTSECSKHCIIFISASHTLLCESNSTQRKMPSLSSGNPDSPLSFIYFFFSPLLLRDQWSRCNTYYRGFQDLRISWRWLEINLHNPPWSLCSPSPLRLVFSFYLTLEAPQNGHALREAPRLFKKRAWLEGSGGYGTRDHEACGPIPAAFS